MSLEWQLFVQLNERMRPMTDPLELQELTVRAVGEHLRANRVCYSSVRDDVFVVTRSYCNGVRPLPSPGSRTVWGKAILETCATGETVTVDDVDTDPRLTEAERAGLRAYDVRAFVGVPLIKDGRWASTFAVQSATPRAWTGD